MSTEEKWNGGSLLIAGATDFEYIGRKPNKNDKALIEKLEKRSEIYPNLLSPTFFSTFTDVDVNFVSTGCQAQHCIVVDMNGIAYSFGKNNKGQLGVGDFIQRNQPVVMAKLDGKTVISAACGKSHSLIVCDDGSSMACGSNKYGQLGTGSCSADGKVEDNKMFLVSSAAKDVKMVAAGSEFSMWLTNEGQLYAAGSGEHGQLGDGSDHTFNSRASSIKMEVEPSPRPRLVRGLNANGKVLTVACGSQHTIAITDEVAAYTWGCGDYGRLGHNVQKDEFIPKKLEAFNSFRRLNEKAQAAGGGMSTLLTTGAGCYQWGKMKNSGDSIMSPQLASDFQGWSVRCVSAAASTFGVAAERSTMSWGQAKHGELGLGPNGKKSSAAPTLVNSFEGCLTHQIACGNGFVCFVMDKNDDATKKALTNFETYDAPEKDPFADEPEGSKKKAPAKRTKGKKNEGGSAKKKSKKK